MPARKGGWWYYTRTVEGKQYPVHCRRAAPAGRGAPPRPTGTGRRRRRADPARRQRAGRGHGFFSLGAFSVSPDGQLLAYSTDFAGDERFTLRVKDLVDRGRSLATRSRTPFYGSAWSLDGSALFYLTVDDAWRPYRVWRHTVGTPAADDVIVFEEADERFWVGVGLTRSERYLVIIDGVSKLTSEVWLLDAGDPTASRGSWRRGGRASSTPSSTRPSRRIRRPAADPAQRPGA